MDMIRSARRVSVLDGVEVNIVQVATQVLVVADDVIVEAFLPERVRSSGLFEAPSHISLHRCDHVRKACSVLRDEHPMQVVAENDVRHVSERVFCLDPTH